MHLPAYYSFVSDELTQWVVLNFFLKMTRIPIEVIKDYLNSDQREVSFTFAIGSYPDFLFC